MIFIYTNNNDNYEYIGINTNFDLCISNKKTNSYYDLYSTVQITNPDIKFKEIDDSLKIKKIQI